ncbi:hypothetical protein [Paraburkholderia caribensis]|uniref:hypothetical protein n=1 Tax=Paraburkholderia caribensis TaxID=75105 RepID=UPI0011DF8FE2|nr:hypothetical protein [Paraburkholderia caribensis]
MGSIGSMAGMRPPHTRETAFGRWRGTRDAFLREKEQQSSGIARVKIYPVVVCLQITACRAASLTIGVLALFKSCFGKLPGERRGVRGGFFACFKLVFGFWFAFAFAFGFAFGFGLVLCVCWKEVDQGRLSRRGGFGFGFGLMPLCWHPRCVI